MGVASDEPPPIGSAGPLTDSPEVVARLPGGLRVLRASRASRGWALLLFALFAWGSFVAVARARMPDTSICLFRNVTGGPCPTCGGTRMAVRLSSGEVVGALAMNPMLFGGLILLITLFVLRVGFGLHVGLPESPRARHYWYRGFAAVILANWIYVITWVG